ncbi:MAG: TIGR02281 family clan AA aspartic protease [Marinosulfonomonas sp.]|nr:TIGR02281 family clan AA aspartic protease [Marinosulfonomonas sp.]
MSGDDYGRLAYLGLILVAVSGWLIAESRTNLGKTARHAAIWGLIFIGTVGAVGLWPSIRDQVMPRQSMIGSGMIEVPRGVDGHYRLVLTISGVAVDFIVDTGATDVVLSPTDARRVGLDQASLNFSGTARTANGIVRTARAQVSDVRLGDIVDLRLGVSVNSSEMDSSLLGMSYLQRFERIEIAADRLILTR